MKRMALIAVLLLILTLLPAALADTQPSVSFTTNQITAQCGNTVTLTLAATPLPAGISPSTSPMSAVIPSRWCCARVKRAQRFR